MKHETFLNKASKDRCQKTFLECFKFPVSSFKKNGFSLVELLLVTSIIALVTVFVFNSLTAFRQQSDVDTTSQGMLSVLRLARSKTLSSQNASGYGVYFQSATYTLFTGRVYVAGSTSNDAHVLPETMEIFDINLSTTAPSVIFDRLTGKTSTTGTVSLRPLNNPSQVRIIRIDASGAASFSATSVAILDTRITDTRHLHFDLGWTIQNATVLRLRFSNPPNPDIVNDITMNPPAPRSQFAWEGDTNVYGQNQHIQVAAHSLTGSDTQLSIRRYANLNNRALTVSIIDGIEKSIVSYTASGTATVQIYGGSMTVQ